MQRTIKDSPLYSLLAPTTKTTSPPTPRPEPIAHATFSRALPAPASALHPERQHSFRIGCRVSGSLRLDGMRSASDTVHGPSVTRWRPHVPLAHALHRSVDLGGTMPCLSCHTWTSAKTRPFSYLAEASPITGPSASRNTFLVSTITDNYARTWWSGSQRPVLTWA